MNRLIGVVACSLSLAACGSISMPSMPSFDVFGSKSGPAPASGTASVRVESEPPGADARTSGGQGCRTPCSLTVTAQGDFTVNFSLNGYQPQSVSARVVGPDDVRGDPDIGAGAGEPRIVPNPIFAALDPAPPPPPAQRRKPPRRPRPAAQNAAPPPPGDAPPPSSALTPFPNR
jgi:PEGA domain-containing protein